MSRDQEKLDVIIRECTEHNADVCDEERDPERIQSDAKFIYMMRHEGITPETLAMMLTDTTFALKQLRTTPSPT